MLEVGDEITDAGFLSVTEDRGLAETFQESSPAHGGDPGALIRITVKRPQPAGEMADAIEFYNEDSGGDEEPWSEFVFGRDSKMVVVGEHDDEDGKWLEVELN